MQERCFQIVSKYLEGQTEETVEKKSEPLSDKQRMDIITEVIDRDFDNIIEQYVRRQDTEMLYLVADFLSKRFSDTSAPHDRIFDNLSQYRNRIYKVITDAALMPDNSIKSYLLDQTKNDGLNEDDLRDYARRFLVDMRKETNRYIRRISNI